MTPPGLSPGEVSQEDDSSDISDVVYDEHGNELVELNYSPELLKKRAEKRARRAAKTARRASRNQGIQQGPAEKAPYLKSELGSQELARISELRRSF
jgi:hypothetical protein